MMLKSKELSSNSSTEQQKMDPTRRIGRSDLQHARRVVVKIGTSVVTTKGEPALGRIASIIEQICMLKREGREVMLVTSGSIGIGRQQLYKQVLLSASLRTHIQGTKNLTASKMGGAFAAAGQIGLMSLYQTLFSLYDVVCAQVLVTATDFNTLERRSNMRTTLNNLLDLDVIPIINENDAVSMNVDVDNPTFTDNDSLASLVAGETQADLLMLLTDVDGVYDKPPSEPGSKVVHTYREKDSIRFGDKSSVGRGGMQAKIAAAQKGVESGVTAVVIGNGLKYGMIGSILKGAIVGTMFAANPVDDDHSHVNSSESLAISAREASRKLQLLTSLERADILRHISGSLIHHQDAILMENEEDMKAAQENGVDEGLQARLKLSKSKIQVLADGINSIASAEEPIGRMISRTEVASGLVLEQETTPIGVLLIIFESRPDSLPQIASLALRSGNGLLLKGGKEAIRSNFILHKVIVDAIHEASKGKVPRSVIGLIQTRDEVSDLLKLDHVIDLVIPRGSGSLVSYIKHHTKIPVLGHAEGVCHVYVHSAADMVKAIKIAVDAKIDYPSACNACETLLLDQSLIKDGRFTEIINALKANEVSMYAGPSALKLPAFKDWPAAKSLSEEYGTKALTVEVVTNVDDAMHHINAYGSGHTDCIVTEDKETAEHFLKGVDSACVFHNASTRFADGYRFGLGAEVGISTGRIHARGPVGVEGLLTTKWKLHSDEGHVVADFSSAQAKPLLYTHKKLAVIQHNASNARPKSSRL